MTKLFLAALLPISFMSAGCVQSGSNSAGVATEPAQMVGAVESCEDGVLWLRLASGKVEEIALPDAPAILPPDIHLSQGRACRVEWKSATLTNEEGSRYTTPQVTKFEWL